MYSFLFKVSLGLRHRVPCRTGTTSTTNYCLLPIAVVCLAVMPGFQGDQRASDEGPSSIRSHVRRWGRAWNPKALGDLTPDPFGPGLRFPAAGRLFPSDLRAPPRPRQFGCAQPPTCRRVHADAYPLGPKFAACSRFALHALLRKGRGPHFLPPPFHPNLLSLFLWAAPCNLPRSHLPVRPYGLARGPPFRFRGDARALSTARARGRMTRCVVTSGPRSPPPCCRHRPGPQTRGPRAQGRAAPSVAAPLAPRAESEV
jgi:hypothetical protein